MISNQILQSTIDGLKSITRKELSVVEKEGKVIATTEENMIGRQIDAVENFISSPAESQLILGYQYFKIYDNGVPEYVIQVKGRTNPAIRSARLPHSRFRAFWLRIKKDMIRTTLSRICCWITCCWWIFTAARRSCILKITYIVSCI